MDFNISEKGQDYLNRVKQFMKDEIFPIEELSPCLVTTRLSRSDLTNDIARER